MKRVFYGGIIAILLSTSQVGSGQVTYSITDFGNYNLALCINNAGQVAGSGFVYTGSAIQLGEGGQAINNEGQVAAGDASFYIGGPLVEFGTLGGVNCDANSINDSGQIVGWSDTSSGAIHAFIANGTSITDLNTLLPAGSGWTLNIGDGINNAGEIVGSGVNPSGASDGFLFNGNSVTDLGTFGGSSSEAIAINGSGQIVGDAEASGNSARDAFLYSGGKMINLGTLGGFFAEGQSINDVGQIVGSSETSGNGAFHAFISNGKSMTDLNTLLPAGSGWTLEEATGINNAGQIVGYGTNSTGQTHGFLLTPLPQAPLTYVPPPPEIPISNPQPNQVIPDLAVYQNGTWNPVTTHSLGTDVHVLVHGWAPGQLTWVQTQLENGQPAEAWDDTSYFSGFTNLAQAMEAKDPGSSVVAYSWITLSATPPVTSLDPTVAEQSRQWTDTAGDILAAELKQALPTSGLQDLQLFGHSHGARVATIATENLENSGINVNQLTLADSPEASISLQGGLAAMGNAENDLAPELEKLNLGRSTDQTFVDNYISSFGVPYRDPSNPQLASIVDVTLQPNVPEGDFSDAHVYPISWYANATNVPGTQDGLAWSPALGTTASSLANSYTQDWANPNLPGEFLSQYETRLKGSDGSYLNNFAVTNTQSSASATATSGLSSDNPSQTIRSVTLNTLSTTGTVSSTSSDVRLSENGNAVWMGSLDLLPGDQSLNFDYQFLSPGSGADLGIWIDDDLRFVLTGAVAGSGIQSSEFDISDYGPGPHTLSIGLYTYAGGDAVVDVSNLSITSIPEPGSLGLLPVTLFVIGRRRFYINRAFARA